MYILAATEISSIITGKIIKNLFMEKPKLNENGDFIYSKSGLILFSGLALFFIFSLCTVFMDYYVPEIIKESNLDISMMKPLYITGYSIEAFFILLGLWQILIYAKYEIIVNKESISQRNIFSTKTIMLHDIEIVKYSYSRVFVFKSSDSKIAFGMYTKGIIEFIYFVDGNIPKYKTEKAIIKAEKMLKASGLPGYW